MDEGLVEAACQIPVDSLRRGGAGALVAVIDGEEAESRRLISMCPHSAELLCIVHPSWLRVGCV